MNTLIQKNYCSDHHMQAYMYVHMHLTKYPMQ